MKAFRHLCQHLPDRRWAVARHFRGERGPEPSTPTLTGPSALRSHPPEYFRSGAGESSRDHSDDNWPGPIRNRSVRGCARRSDPPTRRSCRARTIPITFVSRCRIPADFPAIQAAAVRVRINGWVPARHPECRELHAFIGTAIRTGTDPCPVLQPRSQAGKRASTMGYRSLPQAIATVVFRHGMDREIIPAG
jgi:hypothetical protein